MKPFRKHLPDVEEESCESASSAGGDRSNMNFQFHIVIQARGSETGETEIQVSGSTPSKPSSEDSLPPISVTNLSTRAKKSTAGYQHHLPSTAGLQPRKSSPARAVMAQRSRYHAGCCGGNRVADSRPAVTRRHVFNRSGGSPDVPTSQQVTDYLNENPHFLEQYIMNEVELETVERLMIRKTKRSRRCMMNEQKGFQGADKGERKTSLSRWKFCVHADKRKMLQELTLSLHKKPTKSHVLWEVSSCISTAVGADGFDLYLPWKGKKFDLVVYVGDETKPDTEIPVEPVKVGDRPIAQFVAESLEPVRTSYIDIEQGNPNMKNLNGEVAHILCQPIVEADGQLVGVLEMWRRDLSRPFHEEDEEIAVSYLVWGGVALHYAHMYLNMTKQKNLTDFLLTVVKSIFQDMVSMEMLVKKVMNFAQKLVDADRASLFLVDSRQSELYATIFDVGIDNGNGSKTGSNPQPSTSEEDPGKDKREIRFPLGTGIAGHVAQTGNVLNIRDAYADPRFNRTVDQLTGYKTDTILCMPIYIRGIIIGVVQMVNKHSGYFTNEDVEAFEMFAVYCGLALHHAKLYDKIRRSEQKYKVALEVLSYHNTCTEKEVEMALQDIAGLETLKHVDLNDYYFSPFELQDCEKANYAIVMFTDLFGLQDFDQHAVVRFTLTVKKNYRRVPYHNWTHGFSVAHCMYGILKKSNKVFKRNECLALFIAALCHDLDHRGKNNKFMLETASPLAAIYSTSTMEHHHFNQTVTILQQDGHNIFGKLTSQEYKDVLSLVKHCILATDLAMFFPNRKKMEILVKEYEFSFSQTEHRLLLQAIAMTSSDLSASAKPWEIQVKTVKVIFEEFYEQGDAEKAAGINTIPMMDRERPDEQAASQVGFLTGICIPCYSLLNEIIPESKPLLDMCKSNLSRWREIDADPSQRSTALDDIPMTGDRDSASD